MLLTYPATDPVVDVYQARTGLPGLSIIGFPTRREVTIGALLRERTTEMVAAGDLPPGTRLVDRPTSVYVYDQRISDPDLATALLGALLILRTRP